MIAAAPRTLLAPSQLLPVPSRRLIIVSGELHGQSRRRPPAPLTAVVRSDRYQRPEMRVRLNVSGTTENSRETTGLSAGRISFSRCRKRLSGRAEEERVTEKNPGAWAGAAGEGGDVTGINVRPINIREDWAARLDELEKGVEELQKLEA